MGTFLSQAFMIGNSQHLPGRTAEYVLRVRGLLGEVESVSLQKAIEIAKTMFPRVNRSYGERFLSKLRSVIPASTPERTTSAQEQEPDPFLQDDFSAQAGTNASPEQPGVIRLISCRLALAVERTKKTLKTLVEAADIDRVGGIGRHIFVDLVRKRLDMWITDDDLNKLIDYLDRRKRGIIKISAFIDKLDYN
jgi:hypothetical protein